MLHFMSHAQDLKNSLPPARNLPADGISKDSRRWPFRVAEAASPELPAVPRGRVREVTPPCAFVT